MRNLSATCMCKKWLHKWGTWGENEGEDLSRYKLESTN